MNDPAGWRFGKPPSERTVKRVGGHISPYLDFLLTDLLIKPIKN